MCTHSHDGLMGLSLAADGVTACPAAGGAAEVSERRVSLELLRLIGLAALGSGVILLGGRQAGLDRRRL